MLFNVLLLATLSLASPVDGILNQGLSALLDHLAVAPPASHPVLYSEWIWFVKNKIRAINTGTKQELESRKLMNLKDMLAALEEAKALYSKPLNVAPHLLNHMGALPGPSVPKLVGMGVTGQERVNHARINTFGQAKISTSYEDLRIAQRFQAESSGEPQQRFLPAKETGVLLDQRGIENAHNLKGLPGLPEPLMTPAEVIQKIDRISARNPDTRQNVVQTEHTHFQRNPSNLVQAKNTHFPTNPSNLAVTQKTYFPRNLSPNRYSYYNQRKKGPLFDKPHLNQAWRQVPAFQGSTAPPFRTPQMINQVSRTDNRFGLNPHFGAM